MDPEKPEQLLGTRMDIVVKVQHRLQTRFSALAHPDRSTKPRGCRSTSPTTCRCSLGSTWGTASSKRTLQKVPKEMGGGQWQTALFARRKQHFANVQLQDPHYPGLTVPAHKGRLKTSLCVGSRDSALPGLHQGRYHHVRSLRPGPSDAPPSFTQTCHQFGTAGPSCRVRCQRAEAGPNASA